MDWRTLLPANAALQSNLNVLNMRLFYWIQPKYLCQRISYLFTQNLAQTSVKGGTCKQTRAPEKSHYSRLKNSCSSDGRSVIFFKLNDSDLDGANIFVHFSPERRSVSCRFRASARPSKHCSAVVACLLASFLFFLERSLSPIIHKSWVMAWVPWLECMPQWNDISLERPLENFPLSLVDDERHRCGHALIGSPRLPPTQVYHTHRDVVRRIIMQSWNLV